MEEDKNSFKRNKTFLHVDWVRIKFDFKANFRMDFLNDFINSEYSEGTYNESVTAKSEILALLNRYNLSMTFDKIISIIKSESGDLRTLASNSLKSVNDSLKNESDIEKKEYAEKLLIEFAFKLIAQQYRYSLLTAKEFFTEYEDSVKQTCFINGYDFSKLIEIIKPEILVNFLEKIPKHNAKKTAKTTYCIWNRDPSCLEKLAEILSSKGIILNPVSFKDILIDNKTETSVIYNKKNFDTFIILFSKLIEEGFISLKNGKAKWKFISINFQDTNGKNFKEKTLANKYTDITKESLYERNSKIIKAANDIIYQIKQ